MDQLFIAITGVTAIFLTQSKDKQMRKYACLFGLMGQPFWFYSAYQAGQAGIGILCVFYTLAWFKGFNDYWLKSESVRFWFRS